MIKKLSTYFYCLFFVAVSLLFAAPKVAAQKTDASQSNVDLSELSLDETLMLPVVPDKQAAYIRDYMHREAKGLQKAGFHVETTRRGEVVIVSIPADELFGQNDTVLMASARKKLDEFLPYFRTHGKFRVVLAMHSDNTGSENYLYSLTERRIIALYDYFDTHAAQTDMLQGYPMADMEPMPNTPNTTMANRAKNRRLEIYIVPGPILIAEAKAKRI